MKMTEVYQSSNNQYCLEPSAMVAAKVLDCEVILIPAKDAASGKLTVFLKNLPEDLHGVAYEFDLAVEATCFLKGLARGVAIDRAKDIYMRAIDLLGES